LSVHLRSSRGYSRIANDIDGFEIRPERLIAQGDTVVMLGRYRGAKAHATGESLDVQAVHVWDLENGKVVRFQQYADTLNLANALGPE
jgi:ketosteroid isomerase-like protein